MMKLRCSLHINTILLFFISFSTHVAANSYYISSSTGNDINNGLSHENPWRTFNKLSASKLSPGDIIHLKSGDTWEESLNITWSGTQNNPIVITSYNAGTAPIIKASNTFNSWQLVVNSGIKKVWGGTMTSVKNSWFALHNNKRTTKYLGYKAANNPFSAPNNIKDMQEGLFYAPLNSGKFYFRHDSGNPGNMEIGARPYAINILNQSYISINNIILMGPGGTSKKQSMTGAALLIIDSSKHIRVNNIVAAHYNMGIRIINGSEDVHLSRVEVFDHRSTGIYLWEAGRNNKVTDCNVHDIGTLISDTGDMGMVGVFKTPHASVINCTLSKNGHNQVAHTDAAISFVQSPNGVIEGNTITKPAGIAIQSAEGSDNTFIRANRIYGWCEHLKENSNRCAAIRIGGGRFTSSVANNVVESNCINTLFKQRLNTAVLKLENGDKITQGLIFRDNTIVNSEKSLLIKAESNRETETWLIENNTIHALLDNKIIEIGNSSYKLSELTGNKHELISEFNLPLGDIVFNSPHAFCPPPTPRGITLSK